MTMIPILDYPDPRLRRVGKKVTEVNDEIKQIVADMFETLYGSENCAALAATQLAFDEPYHITVIDLSSAKNEPMCLINPEISESEGEQHEHEGCMSVYPGYIHEKVKRAYKIRVTALNEKGEPLDFIAEGYLAKCIQHEMDHLNGRTYLDRISSLKRTRLEKKINKVIDYLKQNQDKK